MQYKGCSRGISNELGSFCGATVQPSWPLPAQPALNPQPLLVLSDWGRGHCGLCTSPPGSPYTPPLKFQGLSVSCPLLPHCYFPHLSFSPRPAYPHPRKLSWPSAFPPFPSQQLLVRALCPPPATAGYSLHLAETALPQSPDSVPLPASEAPATLVHPLLRVL